MCMSVDFTQTRSLPLLVSAAARLVRMNPDLGVQLAHLTWLLFQSEIGRKLCAQLMLDADAILSQAAQSLPHEDLSNAGPSAEGVIFYQQYQRQQFCKRFTDALERCQDLSSQAEWQTGVALIFQTLEISITKQTPACDESTAPNQSARARCTKRKTIDEVPAQPACETPHSNSSLSKFGVNLVEKVRMGHPVVGREAEIARIQEILERSSGYCPVLIGKVGVGKTAVVVGLAQRIACEDVPEDFPTQLWALDTNLVIKAMEDPQTCEDFLKAIQEAEETQPILFIDDLHEVLSRIPSQKSNSGCTMASRVAKALLLGKFRCIGATTPANHRLHFMKSSIGQRFQQLHVREASTHTTAKIIQAMIPTLESKRRVRVDTSAIRAAVTLAHEHMPDAVLPSSAIELLNSACEIARCGKSSSGSSSGSSVGFISPPPSPPHVPHMSDDDDDQDTDSNMTQSQNAGPVPNVDTTSKELLRSQQSSRLIVTTNAPKPQISSKAGHLFHCTKSASQPESGKRRALANHDPIASLTRMVATAGVYEPDSDSETDSDAQDEEMDLAWEGLTVVSALHVRSAIAALVAK